MKSRNNKIMTYEQFVEAVKKESAELPVSKRYPEDYAREITRWEKEDSMEDYEKGHSVDDAVGYIDLMV